ncbi:universal stress protein [Nocardia huaxiensis]|uniref:universal stress protein n=1 Tax=Nocardia huaxiensis TaxID=2755382 RepID=UPI001E5D99E1|nr:universal stress protein [Nocardia huaxiensis]UFS97968.1 universal stress protein [Nocardia huaxiensis]
MTQQDYDDPHRAATAAVVVGVDGSPGSDRALRWAADYAADRDRDLLIVHGLALVSASSVVGPYEVVMPDVIDSIHARGRALLTHAEARVREYRAGLRISALMTSDTGAALLISRSADAYAVVLGATGTIGTIGHLGSTLLAVTSHAKGTVIVVRPESEDGEAVRRTGPVVVGVDGSPVGEAAIAAAFAEAAERRAELVAVHAWSDWAAGTFAGQVPPLAALDLETVEEAVLAERLAGWQEKYPDVVVTRRLYPAGPGEALLDWSKVAQLLVVGNRGRGGFRGLLLGSTAHTLVQHAHCPVMVVHPDHGEDTRR